jgi:phytoene dehydrogenase-like protein
VKLTSDDPSVFVPRSSDLALHAWDDGVVVYDDADGSLHALSPVAGDALALLLAHGAETADHLAELLLQEPPNESDIAMVASLLVEFEAMGFVERRSA